jgi:hypothetical protein
LCVLPVAIAVVFSVGCAGDPDGLRTGLFEVTGTNQFRYTVKTSDIHPINDEQAEHHRLVQLHRHVRAAGLCPEGYHLIRDPPMAFGSVNKRMTQRMVRNVTYVGVCDGSNGY